MISKEQSPVVIRGVMTRFFDGVVARGGNFIVSAPSCITRRTPGLFLFGDPQDIRTVFSQEDDMDKQGFLYKPRELFGDGLLTMSGGEKWKRHQLLVGPRVVPHSIAGLASLITEKTQQSMDDGLIQRRGEKLIMPDVYSRTKVLDLQIMVQALMGRIISVDCAQELIDAFSYGNKLFQKNLLTLGAYYELGKRFPPVLEQARRKYGILQSFAEESINANPVPGTFAEALHNAVHNNSMSMAEAVGEFNQSLAASYGTTAASVTWLLSFLARRENRGIQSQIREELHIGGEAWRSKESLLYRSFLEALRLRPPAHVTTRQAIQDIDVNLTQGKKRIPNGSIVLTSQYVAHHLPAVWENPKIFDPERFRPERFGKKQRDAFMPFGVGERSCIGRNLALHVGPQIIGTILRNHRVTDDSASIPGSDFGATLKPARTVNLAVEMA